MKPKERPGRLRPLVLGTLLAALGLAWLWLVRGGSNPSGVRAPALQALCNTAAAASWPPDIAAASTAAVEDISMRHIYVVGCGHSGTSLLKRTIGNLPGLRCLPKETWLYERMGSKPQQLKIKLRKWDLQAEEGNYTGWVEKTPRHVNHIDEMLKHDTSARVVFIVRDGRDVAASLLERGFPWPDCLGRWVKDNSAALPFLDNPRVLTVKFEEFGSPEGVLGVLRQLSAFVGVPAPTERLLLALQPPTALLTDDEQCVAYASEADKLADLAGSYMQQMAAGGGGVGGNATAAKGDAPGPRDHKNLRAWQSSQAWAPQRSTWQHRLTKERQEAFGKSEDFQRLLQHFGYT